MDFTNHTQLLRKYRCLKEHLCFYALTTLFPSISGYRRSHTRADKKDCDSNDDPVFSQTHFHSVKWLTPRVLSALIMMALTWHGSPRHRCLYAYYGDNLADIDQSILACNYTLLSIHACFASSFPDLLASCLAVLATTIQIRLSLVMSPELHFVLTQTSVVI